MGAHPRIGFGLIRYAWWPAPATRKAVRLVVAGHARRHGLYLADIVELEQTPVRDSLSLRRLVNQIKSAVDKHGHTVLVTNQPLDPSVLDPDLTAAALTVIVVDPFNSQPHAHDARAHDAGQPDEAGWPR